MPAEQALVESDSSAPQLASPQDTPADPADTKRRFNQLLIDAGLVPNPSPESEVDPQKADEDAVFERAYANYVRGNGITASTELDEFNDKATAAAKKAVARFRDGKDPFSDEELPEAKAQAGDETGGDQVTEDDSTGRSSLWVSPYRASKAWEPPVAGSFPVADGTSGASKIHTWFKGDRPEDASVTVAPAIGFHGAQLAIGTAPKRLAIAARPAAPSIGQRSAEAVAAEELPTNRFWGAGQPSTNELVGESETASLGRTGEHELIHHRHDADDVTVAGPLVPVSHVYPADATTTMHLPAHVLDGVSPVVFEPGVYRTSGRPPRNPVFADMFLDGADAEYTRDSRLEVIEAARRARRTRRLQRVGIMFSDARASFGRSLRHLVRADRIRRADGTFSVRPELVPQPVVFGGARRGSTYQSRGAGSHRIIV